MSYTPKLHKKAIADLEYLRRFAQGEVAERIDTPLLYLHMLNGSDSPAEPRLPPGCVRILGQVTTIRELKSDHSAAVPRGTRK